MWTCFSLGVLCQFQRKSGKAEQFLHGRKVFCGHRFEFKSYYDGVGNIIPLALSGYLKVCTLRVRDRSEIDPYKDCSP